jgi:hypothetical protein
MATNMATQTQINVAFPEAAEKHLTLAVGACKLKAVPGGEAWLSGTYDPGETGVPVKIDQQGGNVRVTQEYKSFYPFGWFNKPPRFDLALGKAQPYRMTIEMGASDNSFDLGGVSVTRLNVKQGAGRSDIDFSAPNPQPMSLLKVEAGAIGLEMKNLANANFAEMLIDGGAAAYKFDFGGTLQRDAHVKITTGMSSVEIFVPSGMAVKVSAEMVMGGFNIADGFTKKDGAYWSAAAIQGQTPVLTIDANVSLGSLAVKMR